MPVRFRRKIRGHFIGSRRRRSGSRPSMTLVRSIRAENRKREEHPVNRSGGVAKLLKGLEACNIPNRFMKASGNTAWQIATGDELYWLLNQLFPDKMTTVMSVRSVLTPDASLTAEQFRQLFNFVEVQEAAIRWWNRHRLSQRKKR